MVSASGRSPHDGGQAPARTGRRIPAASAASQRARHRRAGDKAGEAETPQPEKNTPAIKVYDGAKAGNGIQTFIARAEMPENRSRYGQESRAVRLRRALLRAQGASRSSQREIVDRIVSFVEIDPVVTASITLAASCPWRSMA